MTSVAQRLSRDQMAERLVKDIPPGSYLNLGIGLPTKVANYLSPEKDIILHTENGLLGMGRSPDLGQEDEDLVNAGKQPVTIVPGASFFHHADSFGMIRGGRIDFCVMGAFQVSIEGDLANWHTGDEDAIPAVGGAMDLAIGAKNVYVLMELLTRQDESKLVRRCTYPLTGMRCVKRVYTDMAVFEITGNGVVVVEMVPGLSLATLEDILGFSVKLL